MGRLPVFLHIPFPPHPCDKGIIHTTLFRNGTPPGTCPYTRKFTAGEPGFLGKQFRTFRKRSPYRSSHDREILLTDHFPIC